MAVLQTCVTRQKEDPWVFQTTKGEAVGGETKCGVQEETKTEHEGDWEVVRRHETLAVLAFARSWGIEKDSQES